MNSFVEENNRQRLNQIEENVLRIKKMGFGEYKKHHTKFINAQYDMKYRVYLKIAKEKNGVEKLMKLSGASRKSVLNFIEKYFK